MKSGVRGTAPSINHGVLPLPEQDVTNRLLAIAALLPVGATVTMTAHAFQELAQEHVLRSMADLTVSDVARIYDVSRSTVRAWIRSGLLEAYRVGKRYFVTPAAIEAFKNGKRERGRRSVAQGSTEQAETSKLGSWRRVRSHQEKQTTRSSSCDNACDNRS